MYKEAEDLKKSFYENDFIEIYIVFSILLFIIILLGYCNLGYTYKNEEVQTLL